MSAGKTEAGPVALPAVPAEVMQHVHAYGDARADNEPSHEHLKAAIAVMRQWAGALAAHPPAQEQPAQPLEHGGDRRKCRDCADFGPICPNDGRPCAEQPAQGLTGPEAPPWLLPGDVAQRIGMEYRVRAGAVQAVAKAVSALASAPRVPQEEMTRLRGEASVLRGWIAEALPALEIAEAVEDCGEDGGALLALIEAGKKLAAPQPGAAA